MKTELSRDQAELIVDLLLVELKENKHGEPEHCESALEAIAVQFGMSKGDFKEWLEVML